MEYNGRVRAINWARGGVNVFIVPRSSDPHHMDSLATMSCQQLRAHAGGPGTGFVGVAAAAAAAAAAGADVDADAGEGAGAGAGAHDDQPFGLAEALWCPGNAHAGKCGLLLVGWQESDLAHALFDSNAAETRDVPWKTHGLFVWLLGWLSSVCRRCASKRTLRMVEEQQRRDGLWRLQGITHTPM